uniref:HECT domain-containing protein n=1 Tax=Amphimedon queenslandica TaxID=400682 RepID=A0A1X7SVK8_AMPQE
MIHQGIPDQHRLFWTDLGIDGIANIYRLLSVSAEKFLDAVQECEFRNEAEQRIYNYLIRMIESMKINSLRNFLRFWTGSSVFITDKLFVIFTYGYSPFAHTCGSTLELPLHYNNYQEFEVEWDAILNNIQEEWTWSMDSL